MIRGLIELLTWLLIVLLGPWDRGMEAVNDLVRMLDPEAA